MNTIEFLIFAFAIPVGCGCAVVIFHLIQFGYEKRQREFWTKRSADWIDRDVKKQCEIKEGK